MSILIWLAVIVQADGETSRLRQVEADFNSLESAIAMYRLNARALPSPSIGLRALVERPPDIAPDARWVQVMTKVSTDPWDQPYRYIVGDGFKNGYGIYSVGADGKSTTQGNDPDDINNWRDGIYSVTGGTFMR